MNFDNKIIRISQNRTVQHVRSGPAKGMIFRSAEVKEGAICAECGEFKLGVVSSRKHGVRILRCYGCATRARS